MNSKRAVRRTQEARSDETKRRILDAAFEVLKEKGYSGFTTQEVARRAGVSRGAQLHHFPSKNELVVAAMTHVFDLALAHGLELVDSARTSDEPLAALLKDTCAFYFSDHFYVGLDMLLAGAKNPDLRDAASAVVRNYRRPVEVEWLSVMMRLGLPQDLTEKLMLLTVSLVRGFGIRMLWANEGERVDELLVLWRDMVRVYVASLGRRNRAAEQRANVALAKPELAGVQAASTARRTTRRHTAAAKTKRLKERRR